MAYRFNAFVFLFSELLSLVVVIYLWLSIYKQGNTIAGYSLRALIIYYIFAKFITLTIKSLDQARIIGDQIRHGELNGNLLKPINYLFEKFFSSLGQISFRIIIYIIIALFVYLLGFDIFSSAPAFIYFILSFILAIIINFLIYYIIGVSVFYFGYIVGFNFIMMGIISFFSGNLIPLDILPSWLYGFARYLPFQYIDFIPISIATGRLPIENISRILFIGLIWAVILYIFSFFIYKIGVKKYEAFSV